jgi:hypothetical protein
MASLVIGLTTLALILARRSRARSLDGAAGAARRLASSGPDRRW